MKKEAKPFSFQGYITRIVDGDTVEAELDLGFHITHKVILRLKDVLAPELKEPGGKLAQEKLRLFFDGGWDYERRGRYALVETHKTDKYGRYVAVVFLDDLNVNEQMIAYLKEAEPSKPESH